MATKTQTSRDEAYKKYVDSGYKDESARQAMGAGTTMLTQSSSGVNYALDTTGRASPSSSGGGSSGNYNQSSPQSSYADKLTEYNNSIAEQAAKAKQDALRQAWEGNSQALNSQNATVNNNYTSAANKLNAVQAARLPEFQQQRNASSAEAAQIALRNQELMAASGRGDSGYNRSNALSVDLNRSNAISALTDSENAFKTDVGNQLSDVDNQRVAALNDIAGKLQLGQKQYNDGTLSLTNQLESEKASGALKAFLESTTRADTLAQQSFNNSFQEKQFEQNASLAELQQQFQQKQFQAEQDAQLWQQQFQQQGFSADEAYRMSQTKLQQDSLAAETAYKNAALAKSGSSGGSGGSSGGSTKAITQSSIQGKTNMDDAIISVQEALKVSSPGNVANDIEQKRDSLSRQGINVDTLIKQVWALAGVQTKPEAEDSWR